MAYKPVNRQYIETDDQNYFLNAEEIKNDAIVYFASTTFETVNLTFPATFDAGHTVEAYQGFSQGLGNIVVHSAFQSPVLDNFSKPDSMNLVTIPNSKVKIVELENTLMAYAIVDPNLFLNATTAELTSYRDRYRMRIYNTGEVGLEVGLDAIDIEDGWVSESQYLLEVTTEQYVPKGSDGYLMQRINWFSVGGQSPEGGGVVFDWTKVSDDSKTVEITDNTNGEITFNLYKKPLLVLL